MIVRDLIDRLLAGVQSGDFRGDDPVPAELLEDSVLERHGVAEYIAKKYRMEGGDQDGI